MESLAASMATLVVDMDTMWLMIGAILVFCKCSSVIHLDMFGQSLVLVPDRVLSAVDTTAFSCDFSLELSNADLF